jgi:hypothetical protein
VYVLPGAKASDLLCVSAICMSVHDGLWGSFTQRRMFCNEQVVVVRSSLSFLGCAMAARILHISPLFGHRQHLVPLLARGMFGAAVSVLVLLLKVRTQRVRVCFCRVSVQ